MGSGRSNSALLLMQHMLNNWAISPASRFKRETVIEHPDLLTDTWEGELGSRKLLSGMEIWTGIAGYLIEKLTSLLVKAFWGYRQATKLFTESIEERNSVELLEQVTDMIGRLEIQAQKAVKPKEAMTGRACCGWERESLLTSYSHLASLALCITQRSKKSWRQSHWYVLLWMSPSSLFLHPSS